MKTRTRDKTVVQQERERIAALLRLYGSLLTQKQLGMASQYCTQGKSFSQIAREQSVSRQAVHEAVRSVQQLLEYYEMKLNLLARGDSPGLDPVSVRSRLASIRAKVASDDKVAALTELDAMMGTVVEPVPAVV